MLLVSILGWHLPTVLDSWLVTSYHSAKYVLVGRGCRKHAGHVDVSNVMFGETFP